MKVVVAFLSAFLFSGVAHAGPLTVSVRDGAGRPVANAVATVYPASGLPRGPIRFAWPLRMSQENIDFNPEVLIVPVGG
ncbi:MAG: methylamine utilization protein, partial [Brevundimonas sp.]